MLACLVDAGYVPLAMVEEDSTLAANGAANLSAELTKVAKTTPLPPALDHIIRDTNISHHSVENHNSSKCAEILNSYKPDLIVLGDTRIIKSHILKIPQNGIVNVHPGYLPDIRGNNPYIWAIIHDRPQGCSVHFIDENIDTGPIIVRERLEVAAGTSYPQLLVEINKLCGALLVTAMKRVSSGSNIVIPQDQIKTEFPELEIFRLANPEIKAIAIEKLESNTYAFLV